MKRTQAMPDIEGKLVSVFHCEVESSPDKRTIQNRRQRDMTQLLKLEHHGGFKPRRNLDIGYPKPNSRTHSLFPVRLEWWLATNGTGKNAERPGMNLVAVGGSNKPPPRERPLVQVLCIEKLDYKKSGEKQICGKGLLASQEKNKTRPSKAVSEAPDPSQLRAGYAMLSILTAPPLRPPPGAHQRIVAQPGRQAQTHSMAHDGELDPSGSKSRAVVKPSAADA
ncbi:hypothetical protein AK812_SmicGene24847 [Symbiodinium microadriaticum]|uniref:Uncharacterized protein n=1 Tax=Symbiodinium microadriaticum TaxID=2951 RepID=A0A1Q9DDK8_SYMMI|nr:hypothetical protein AK812_SmicGene24847 [Symbiodinium microadriaticum]